MWCLDIQNLSLLSQLIGQVREYLPRIYGCLCNCHGPRLLDCSPLDWFGQIRNMIVFLRICLLVVILRVVFLICLPGSDGGRTGRMHFQKVLI